MASNDGDQVGNSADDDFDMALSGQFGNLEDMFDGSTEHAANAIDFSDEDELADEEEESDNGEYDGDNEEVAGVPAVAEDEDDFMKELEAEAMEGVDEDEALPINFGEPVGGNGGLADLELEDVDMDSGDFIGGSEDDGHFENLLHQEGSKLKQQEAAATKKEREKRRRRGLIKLYFPTLIPGKPLRMQSLFPVENAEFPYQVPAPAKPLIPRKLAFEVELDQRKTFRMVLNARTQNWLTQQRQKAQQTQKRVVQITDSDLDALLPKPSKPFKPMDSIVAYDKDLVLSTADWDDEVILNGGEEVSSSRRLKVEPIELDNWNVDDDAILEGVINVRDLNLKLDMNDSNLLFVDHSQNKRKGFNVAMVPTNEKLLEARYNISNDKEYDMLKQNYQIRVRSTVGNLSIDHTLPAIRLQSPYYPVKLRKEQVRRFHRPEFQARPYTTMVFAKPKTRKRKRDKGKEVNELFGQSSDLTLGDSAPFFMLEYSEEVPIAFSNFGMGSKLINYYRKRSEDDTSRPKLPVGETHVLGTQDRSPFWNFGFVEPGNIIPTLYNRMVRAPVFRHDPYQTDFLVVRSSGGGNPQRCYIRSIPYMFTVGQTMPVVDVPGPHSRKVTTTSKNRLKMVVFRVLGMNDQQRLLVKDISVHFPDQNDMQNRQRLKEFMEYQRNGEDQGYWKIKQTEAFPSIEDTRKMISPEDVALLEVMQVGLQRLEDYASFTDDPEANMFAKKESEESLQEQLAPWNTSRNFINATQGKAMLQIHGEGDFSGKGEAFSFLKTSMKGGFKASNDLDGKKSATGGHSYNVAVQQKLYDEEIAKVWYAQQKSLGKSKHASRPFDQTILKDEHYIRKAGERLNKELRVLNNTHRNHLKITRMVKDENGIVQRQTEIIKDPKVISLYLMKKKQIEKEMGIEPDQFAPTDDAEENERNKRRLQEELERLQRDQEQRVGNVDSEGRISGKGIGKGKSTSRHCATCGALGHIRTNKSCPLYYTVNNKSNTSGSVSGAGSVAGTPAEAVTPIV
ncbi:unnamed protein product [Kuraishia capsulata CBS 1993]|uniref:Transcription initiation factor TFIID subunit 1 histone acetyltransferase domain-containing protein n=1 Tax=Kuraishia capsulata CBS 1993 TaxID=1382522 RepID=W6MX66_9ASCO|nr:uncharacterized protein KUCA_T00004337001 [Kuraishia capsulata CBS 1993]CDK28355.1 unnamed protein product [Kuraishia capsulata CBS 1993]